MAEKKYISKIKLPNDADTYDITLPTDASITISSVTTPTVSVTDGNVTTTYGTDNITVGSATISFPNTAGTLALTSELPSGFIYDIID